MILVEHRQKKEHTLDKRNMAQAYASDEEISGFPDVDKLASTRTLRLFFNRWAGKKISLLTLSKCLELEGISRKDAKTLIDEWTVSRDDSPTCQTVESCHFIIGLYRESITLCRTKKKPGEKCDT
jgi:hypothetical protein